MMSLENEQQSAQFETLNDLSFLYYFSHWHAKEFLSKCIALKVGVLQDQKIYSLQVRLCIFQPGNFTGWGSGGVKNYSHSFRMMCDRSTVNLLENREQYCISKSDHDASSINQ